MTLTQDLINLQNQLLANDPDDIKSTMNQATQELTLTLNFCSMEAYKAIS